MKTKTLLLIFLSVIFLWSLSIFFTAYIVHKKAERITMLENSFKNINYVNANAYKVKVEQVYKFTRLIKTAYVLNDKKDSDFNMLDTEIFTQDGFLIKNGVETKLNVPNDFTQEKNGGIKSVIFDQDKVFFLHSAKKEACYFSKIYNSTESKDFIKFDCLPDKISMDYNGLGSSLVYNKNDVLISIGTVDANISSNSKFSQNVNSPYGKILKIEMDSLRGIKKPHLSVYSLGHRNPQGMTKFKNQIFSVEHGPKGGDELNKILKGKNYGWPITSYGTRYAGDNDGKRLPLSHERLGFEEPLFALIPSVGISALNKCPRKLQNYYKKNCLLALSLYGNKLRKGRSLIVYLLNDQLDRVNSVEQIYLGNLDFLKFRHFMTNSKNELYEDKDGSIYVSADKKGIYKITFSDFRL